MDGGHSFCLITTSAKWCLAWSPQLMGAAIGDLEQPELLIFEC